MSARYHCDLCGWEGEEPIRRERQSEGCGGVLWTLPCCPACGEEVDQTVMLSEGGEAIA
jgi:hypothetical protein